MAKKHKKKKTKKQSSHPEDKHHRSDISSSHRTPKQWIHQSLSSDERSLDFTMPVNRYNMREHHTLNEEESKEIGKFVCETVGLTSLTLDFVQLKTVFGDPLWEALQPAFEHSSLRVFSMRCSGIPDADVVKIVTPSRRISSKLHTLILDGNNISHKGCIELATLIQEQNNFLNLSILDNSYSDRDVVGICTAICQRNVPFHQLGLHVGYLSTGTAESIASSLKSLLHLVLQSSFISNESAVALGRGIGSSRHLTSITFVGLTRNVKLQVARGISKGISESFCFSSVTFTPKEEVKNEEEEEAEQVIQRAVSSVRLKNFALADLTPNVTSPAHRSFFHSQLYEKHTLSLIRRYI